MSQPQSKVPSLVQKPPTAKAKASTPVKSEPVRFYRVLSADQRIKVEHGDYVLRKGKEIRSDEYPIAHLRNRGVQLEEIDTPGWYIDAQEEGRRKAQALLDAGHDVVVPPPFEPVVVQKTQPAA